MRQISALSIKVLNPLSFKIMPPLKDLYTQAYLHHVAQTAQTLHTPFSTTHFLKDVFDETWQIRTLKMRVHHIAVCLYTHLACTYEKSLNILQHMAPFLKIAPYQSRLGIYLHNFLPHAVAHHGANHMRIAMQALACITPYTSSEFAVRPFLMHHQKDALSMMQAWTQSPCHHVRRLASEGCRPRLPWATSLPLLKKDPSPIFPILDALKDDTSPYVKRSVANNLNDISKDHPEHVVNIAHAWHSHTPARIRLLKHGCRTLLKQGHESLLKLFDAQQSF